MGYTRGRTQPYTTGGSCPDALSSGVLRLPRIELANVALTLDSAWGRAGGGAEVLVLEDAVDAAVLVAEVFHRADLAAASTPALGAAERAARRAVIVCAFEANDAVAAFWLLDNCVANHRCRSEEKKKRGVRRVNLAWFFEWGKQGGDEVVRKNASGEKQRLLRIHARRTAQTGDYCLLPEI